MFDQAEEKKDRLDALAPGVRDDLEKEKRGKLSPEDRAAWEKYREALNAYKKRSEPQDRQGRKPLLQPSVDRDLERPRGGQTG